MSYSCEWDARGVIMWQEYEKFGKFAQSILSRQSKLTDLVQQLETEMGFVADKGKDAPDVKRAEKPMTQLFPNVMCTHACKHGFSLACSIINYIAIHCPPLA